MNSNKRVLVSPLNWGLGHASRDIPVIKKLLENNFEVFIGGEGESLLLLQKEFPELQFIQLPGYTVRYSRSNKQVLKMLFLLPRIFLGSIKEHRITGKIARKYAIDIIISDHRFGVWSKKTYNVFITHQLKIKFPGILSVFEPIYQRISTQCIKTFNECWIPDHSGDFNLSGVLSHLKTRLNNHHFIGPLSRFNMEEDETKNNNKRIDVLFILSGPEPQRSIFEKIIHDQSLKSTDNYALVRGTTRERDYNFDYEVYDMLTSQELEVLIRDSKLVICRSGYSSVMDLVTLKQKAVLVPTPGQTEQEYLAGYLNEKGIFYSVKQKNFELNQAIRKAQSFPLLSYPKNKLLENRVEHLKRKGLQESK